MRIFLIALTTFLVGVVVLTGLFAGLFLALQPPARTSDHAAATAPAKPHMGGAMSMSGSTMMASNSLATRKLTIQHVQRGCHVWSNGKTMSAVMRLHLKPGQKLSVLDQDVDPHQMMELAGPMHLQVGGPMMMNHGMTLTFTKKGVYRLGTRTVEMAGGGMEVKTVGPDNHLRLVVTVA